MTREYDFPVYSSKRHYYYEGKSYRDTDRCCTQAIFHDKCNRCEKCDHCCDCRRKDFDHFDHHNHHKHHDHHNHKCDCGRDHCDSCDKEDKKKDKSRSPLNFFNDSNSSDANVDQDGEQFSFMDQESAELIWVKESCNIKVNTTDTQVGISLQAALQLAISVVLNITIGDSNRSDSVSQELFQYFDSAQRNKQKIYIYNTKDANVTTTDTDLAVNLQVMLQVLIAILIMVDIL